MFENEIEIKYKKVRITYEQFLWLKKFRYSAVAIKNLVCDLLRITPDQIEDINFNYKCYIEVWFREV